MSKPLKVLTIGTLAFTAWAVWYDNHRRSKPDYKQKLVEKRKEELRQKRIKEDPLYYVKTLPIYEGDVNNMQAVQMYMMEAMQEGEQLLATGGDGMKKGCAQIAIAMSYIPMQQRQMAFAQLAQTLPREILVLMQKMMPIAASRVQTQRLQSMFKNQNNVAGGDNVIASARDSSALPANDIIREVNANDENKDDGPDDVDSIDGDSEERVVEVDTLDEVKVEELPEDVSEKKTEDTGVTTPERIEEAINDKPEQVIAQEKSSQNLSNLEENPIEEEQSSIMPEETPLAEDSINQDQNVNDKVMEQSEHEVLNLEPEDLDLEQEQEENEKEPVVVEADTNDLIEDEIIEESAQIEENIVQESKEELHLEEFQTEEAVEAETKVLDESQQLVDESSSSSSDDEDLD